MSLWVLPLFTALLISLFSLALGNEFGKCCDHISDNRLSADIESHLLKIKDIFLKLSHLTRKADNHLSLYIGLNFLMSVTFIHVICGICYSLTVEILKNDNQFPAVELLGWLAPLAVLTVNMFLLTVPLAYINTQVNGYKYILSCATFHSSPRYGGMRT